MMRTIAFPRFRASYVIASCSVAMAVACGYQAPGLMQAILVVGANAQLPLERLAAEADQPTPVSATAVPSAWKERVPASVRDRRAHREVHGYERHVTDYRYWT